MPGDLGHKAGDILDRVPTNHISHSHLLLQTKDNFEMPIILQHMCGLGEETGVLRVDWTVIPTAEAGIKPPTPEVPPCPKYSYVYFFIY